jgi:hypothetical protein
MNIKTGDTVVILEGNPAEFIAINPRSAVAPFIHNSIGVITCTPVYYIATADDRVNASTTNLVTDTNGQVFRNLIGGRPRNIVRK